MTEEFSDRQARRILRGTIIRAANDAWERRARITARTILFIAFDGAATREQKKQISEEVRYLVEKGYLKGNAPRDPVDTEEPEYYELTAEGRELMTGDRRDEKVLI